jgi:drug/metabolite transporter (DMT)-like permease
MIIGLLAAALSAVCYGVASALQASAAQIEPDAGGVDARLLARLARHGPFVVGLALDLVAFIAQFVALRYLAVFVVQAVQAGNLAVTAVVAVPLLGARLAGREWGAIAAVCGGLVMLAIAAGSERAEPVGTGVRWWLLVAVITMVAVGLAVGRLTARFAPVVLGFVAGLGFGIVALAARVLTDLNFGNLIRDPALYALVIGGVVSFLFYATALQRSAVTTVTAAVIIAETLFPALVGVVVLGDRTRPGFIPVAVTGFVVAIAGAILLARFGEPTKANSVNADPVNADATPAGEFGPT